jgi:hypothetical protein
MATKAKLRSYMLDVLHQYQIKIVSPKFMNQRILNDHQSFIPNENYLAEERDSFPKELTFDKAEDASNIEKIKTKRAN